MASKPKGLTPIDKAIQAELARVSLSQRVSQDRLSEATGISQSRISKIFQLQTPPVTVGETVLLSEALDLDFAQLIVQAKRDALNDPIMRHRAVRKKFGL